MTPAGEGPPVRVDRMEDGALWDVVLNTPKANILDMEKIALLREAFVDARSDPRVKAIVLRGEGHHFSFGASVPEHLPGACETMIPAFHGLVRAMAGASVVTIAAVHGQCLGGGLELATICHRVFASPGATLGQPEIVLGVFAPVASIILADRIGRGRAEDLCLSGRVVAAEEAARIGLVDEIAGDPVASAFAYARRHILPHSGSSLRLAARALRIDLTRRLDEELGAIERLYLETLMATRDAREGLNAFLEKRPPRWSDA